MECKYVYNIAYDENFVSFAWYMLVIKKKITEAMFCKLDLSWTEFVFGSKITVLFMLMHEKTTKYTISFH